MMAEFQRWHKLVASAILIIVLVLGAYLVITGLESNSNTNRKSQLEPLTAPEKNNQETTNSLTNLPPEVAASSTVLGGTLNKEDEVKKAEPMNTLAKSPPPPPQSEASPMGLQQQTPLGMPVKLGETPIEIIPSNAQTPQDSSESEVAWKQFKQRYNKNYSNASEELKRREIFIANREFIMSFNEKRAAQFTLGVNQFADLMREEINHLYFSPPAPNMAPPPSFILKQQSASLNGQVDWRNLTVEPVDQGLCRDSAVFAGLASVESAFNKKFLPPVNIKLSEQQIIDCLMKQSNSDQQLACQGKFSMIQVFDMLQQHSHSLTSPEDYKKLIELTGQKCETPPDFAPPTRLAGYMSIHRDNILEALYISGPLCIAIDASQSTFHFYQSGLYHDENCSVDTYNHHAVLVGHSSSTDDDSSKPSYLLRNSFGTSWGESGYMRLLKDEQRNKCLPQSLAIFPNIAGNNSASYSTPEELASSFNTDLNNGLNWSECDSRLSTLGFNEFKSDDDSSKIVSRYLEQFKNPLIQLLLASVVISVFMGQYDDAISISLAILIVITVAFVQEYRSEKSLQELNKLVPPSCKAIRDGKQEDFLAKYLVPGDIVVISTGDRVPADLRIIDCHDLTIDESNLTGETEPVLKTSASKSLTNNNNIATNGDTNNNINNKSNHKPDRDQSLSTLDNLAFMGTLVQSGHGKGIVVSTGDSTQFGMVFKMMQDEDAPKSPLQINMDQLGKHLSIYSMCIIVFIVIVGWLQSRPVVEMFTIGVSLAVAAIPEGLPIVVTVTLALGVMRMAKRKAVVKQLQAVETLGCLHIVCSDKTGTLTKNEMTVTHIYTSESYQAKVSGVGYDEMGDVILQDLGIDQSSQMESIRRLLTAAALCNNAKFDSSGKLMGQATEGAMLVAAKKIGLNDVRDEYNKLEEIPFSSVYKFMAVKCAPHYGRSQDSGGPSFYVKGAIEVILSKCLYYSSAGSQDQLTESHKQDIIRQSEYVESQGLRVLAIAAGQDIESLTFLGFIGIFDAPRPGVMEAIEVLQFGGIQVKMVTGDSKITAQSIAKMIGINGAGLATMSGREIDELLSDSRSNLLEKAERLANVSVFYRVTPQHKLTIVKMLQSLGYVTAMTGDGVNDGVALKKANIGIAMGSTGTDVCKEAADVILMDDNLATIVVALEEGKGIYYNIRNFIRFQLSTSIAALSLIAISTILHIPNPLNAMQILYINILMDGPPAQSLGVEKVDQDVLRQPPRNVKDPVLTRELLTSVLISALIILSGTLIVFISEMSDGVVTPRDTTMTFTCFVLFDLFNALACRSQTKSIFQIGFLTNKTFLYAVGGSLIGQLLVIYCPPFQAIFQTEALSLMDLIFLIGLSSTVFIASELMKLFKNRVFKRKLLHGTSIYLV